MTIDAIIGTWNMAQYLPAAIESLAGANVIVVDDGSTDDTAAVCARYPVKYIRQANSGCCGAPKNTGLKLATADFIAFLDADDICRPERLARQVEVLRANPMVGAVFSNYRNFSAGDLGQRPNHYDGDGSNDNPGCPRIRAALKDGVAILDPREARDLLIDENYAIPSGMMIRRSAMGAGFNTHVEIGEDFLFAYFLAQQWKVALIDYVGALRRIHANNTSGDKLRFMVKGLLPRQLAREAEEDPTIALKLDRWITQRRASIAGAYTDLGKFREALPYAWASRDIRTMLRTLAFGWRRMEWK